MARREVFKRVAGLADPFSTARRGSSLIPVITCFAQTIFGHESAPDNLDLRPAKDGPRFRPNASLSKASIAPRLPPTVLVQNRQRGRPRAECLCNATSPRPRAVASKSAVVRLETAQPHRAGESKLRQIRRPTSLPRGRRAKPWRRCRPEKSIAHVPRAPRRALDEPEPSARFLSSESRPATRPENPLFKCVGRLCSAAAATS